MQYEKGIRTNLYSFISSPNGQLILFWLNGFGPVKAEWGITFTKIDKGNGLITFHNEELGLTSPFFWGNGYSDSDKNSLANVNVVRAVFPKYQERPLVYTNGSIIYNGKSYTLEEAEDINQIAFKPCTTEWSGNSPLHFCVLQLNKVLTSRFQTKRLVRFRCRISKCLYQKKQIPVIGKLYLILFSYVRVPLESADNNVQLQFYWSKVNPDKQQINIPANGKGTRFFVYTTL